MHRSRRVHAAQARLCVQEGVLVHDIVHWHKLNALDLDHIGVLGIARTGKRLVDRRVHVARADGAESREVLLASNVDP